MQAHGKSVTDVAFSGRDTRKCVTVSSDSLVGIWKVHWGDGTANTVNIVLLAKLDGHIGSIQACAICPMDDHLVATAGEDATVRLWSLNELTKPNAQKSLESVNGYNLEHHMLHGHRETIWALAFSPSGKLLASGSSDCNIRIWNVSSTNPTLNCHFRAHESWVRTLAWTEDMQMLASGSTDGLISLWAVPRKYHHPNATFERFEYEDEEHNNAVKTFKEFAGKTGKLFSRMKSGLVARGTLFGDIPDEVTTKPKLIPVAAIADEIPGEPSEKSEAMETDSNAALPREEYSYRHGGSVRLSDKIEDRGLMAEEEE